MKPRDAALFIVLALLPGCGVLDQQKTPEDRAVLSDCRTEADRIFNAQNRYQISERNSSDTPYSGGSLPDNPSTGLADRYARDQLVDSCLAHQGASNTPPAPAK